MISPGTFTVRCDGIDPSTGDRCKSSKVLSVAALDIARMHPEPVGEIAFFGARLPADWQVEIVQKKILCPACKK